MEQEVVADDTPAVIAVMKADKARCRSLFLFPLQNIGGCLMCVRVVGDG